VTYYNDGNRHEVFEGSMDSTGSYVEFFPSGKIKRKFRVCKGKVNGEYMSFFEDGKLFEKRFFINDLQFGCYQIYYPSGNLRMVGNTSSSMLTGDNVEYFDEPERIKSYSEYLIVEGAEFCIRKLELNERSALISISSFLEVTPRNDSIEIALHMPRNDEMLVAVGGFDSDFNELSDVPHKGYRSKEFRVTVSMTDDTLRGLVSDVRVLSDSTDGRVSTVGNDHYFEYPRRNLQNCIPQITEKQLELIFNRILDDEKGVDGSRPLTGASLPACAAGGRGTGAWHP
jgi:hypothetical protein